MKILLRFVVQLVFLLRVADQVGYLQIPIIMPSALTERDDVIEAHFLRGLYEFMADTTDASISQENSVVESLVFSVSDHPWLPLPALSHSRFLGSTFPIGMSKTCVDHGQFLGVGRISDIRREAHAQLECLRICGSDCSAQQSGDIFNLSAVVDSSENVYLVSPPPIGHVHMPSSDHGYSLFGGDLLNSHVVTLEEYLRATGELAPLRPRSYISSTAAMAQHRV